MKLFIVIPCYNEVRRLAAVIQEVKSFGEVVVVDDGSRDNSYQVAQSQGVKVLRHLVNRGQGAALQTGNNYALSRRADLVVHFDADGQHQAEDIPKLASPITAGQADVVFGSRFLNVRDNNQLPFFKEWLILKPAIFFQNLLYGVKLTDAHNGLRAMSRKALEQIVITQDGMAHPSEIIDQLIIHNLPYLEVPVTIRYDEFGQGLLGGLKIIRDLIFGKINK